MKDYLVKALAYNGNVRIYVTTTTNAINDIGNRLNYLPSALDAVGRVMSMTVMMGSMLKLEETVTVRVEGNGPIGKIIADGDAHGHIRAYCENPYCHFEYNDFRLNAKATVGNSGFISVIKDLKLKEPFIGSVPIINGELAEDFAYYYSVSEQIPSAVSLGVLINTDAQAIASGGFIVQLLPNTDEEVIIEFEKKIKNLPPITEMLDAGLTPEEIVKNIANDAEIIETVPVIYQCNCSKEKFARGIISLGSEEIEDMIKSPREQTETICHFCGNKYYFSKDELKELLMIATSKKK